MGTNYYAHIRPKQEQVDELIDKIKAGEDYKGIIELVQKLYGQYTKDYDERCGTGGIVHLGKASHGWKFLWAANTLVFEEGHLEPYQTVEYEDGSKSTKYHYIVDKPRKVKLYPLTKKGLKQFIDREDVTIYDEYGEKQDKEEFWKMAMEWYPDGYDMSKTPKIDRGATYGNWMKYEIHREGLVFSKTSDFS